mmetsp:Transcript_61728/g.177725  ORF Transcript_61728/g.177725 Transcript_61728/m.177725 type:complete len:252 (-) Transcript_61728:31-786(-)
MCCLTASLCYGSFLRCYSRRRSEPSLTTAMGGWWMRRLTRERSMSWTCSCLEAYILWSFGGRTTWICGSTCLGRLTSMVLAGTSIPALTTIAPQASCPGWALGYPSRRTCFSTARVWHGRGPRRRCSTCARRRPLLRQRPLATRIPRRSPPPCCTSPACSTDATARTTMFSEWQRRWAFDPRTGRLCNAAAGQGCVCPVVRRFLFFSDGLHMGVGDSRRCSLPRGCSALEAARLRQRGPEMQHFWRVGEPA